MSSSEEAFESADEGDNEAHDGQKSPKLYSIGTSSSKSSFAVDESLTSGIQESITSVSTSANTDGWEAWDDDWGSASPCDRVEDSFAKDTSSRTEPDCSSDSPKKDATKHIQEQPAKQRIPLRLERKASLTKSTSPLKESEIQVLEKLSLSAMEKNKSSESVGSGSSWGFGSWGSSLLSCAASVTEFTSHVSQGLGVVMNTVEATLGVPSPEELVRQGGEQPCLSAGDQPDVKTETFSGHAQGRNVTCDDGKGAASHLLGSVASLTHVLESTGSKVITSGLDTLEIIGKKTMDIITEGDPGLRKKRLLFNQRSTSSTKANSSKEGSPDTSPRKSENEPNYNDYFEEHQGRVHLEALELLSGQAEARVQKASSGSEVKWIHKLVEEGFVRIQEHEDSIGEEKGTFGQDVDACLKEMIVETCSIGELVKVCRSKAWERIDVLGGDVPQEPKEIYKECLVSLAALTAKSIELVHRLAELLAIKETLDVCSVIDQILRLAEILSQEVSSIAMAFVNTMNRQTTESCEDTSSVDYFNTYIFLEASNSRNLIQDAIMCVVPVLQQKQVVLT